MVGAQSVDGNQDDGGWLVRRERGRDWQTQAGKRRNPAEYAEAHGLITPRFYRRGRRIACPTKRSSATIGFVMSVFLAYIGPGAGFAFQIGRASCCGRV